MRATDAAGASGDAIFRLAVVAADPIVANGTDGDDWLAGLSGNDSLSGADGNDYLIGRAGDDTLNAGTGGGAMAGGLGNDTYVFNPGDGDVTIDQDQNPSDSSGRYAGSGDMDVIRFGAGIAPDEIVASFSSGTRALTLTVRGGSDTIHLEGWRSPNVRAIERFEFADGTVWTNDTVPVLPIIGTDGDDWLSGTSGKDTLLGGGGHDYLYGAAGDDTLCTGADGGVLVGGLGNDTYLFHRGDGDVTIDQRHIEGDESGFYAGTGDKDVIRFGPGIDASDIVVTFLPGSGALRFNVAGGRDTLQIPGWRSQDYRQIEGFEFADGTIWTDDTVPVLPITGTEGDDWLFGTSGKDTLSSGLGNDVVFGQAGNDTLLGDGGNDYLFGEAGNDSANGGDGMDSLSGAAGDDTLSAGAGGGVLTGGLGNDIYVFNRGDGDVTINQHIAEDSDSGFYAGAGDTDIIRFGSGIASGDIGVTFSPSTGVLSFGVAGGGSDAIHLPVWRSPDSREIDRFEFADGTVWMADTIPNPVVVGSVGDDTLSGGTGDDRLDGGEGNDTLVAGAGNNSLAGGEGDDTFVIDASAGVDHISDSGGVDTLVLDGGMLGDISLGVGSLKITANSIGREIHINDFDPEDPLGPGGIEYFRFADGGTLSKQELIAKLGFNLIGGESDDTLIGTAVGDRLIGNGGNDRLQGGRGNDLLMGGDGNDTYIFARGAGDDTVVDSTGANAGNLLVFGQSITRDSLKIEVEESGLRIRYGLTDSVLLQGCAPGAGVISGIEFADGDHASLGYFLDRAPLALVAINSATAVEDSLFSYTISDNAFSDPDGGDQLSISASTADGPALPPWLAFDPGTSTFSGTPANGDVGTVTVALTATDPYGKSAKIQFDIAVANTNDDPAGVVSIGGTTTQGETLAASCALNDEDGLGPISYQWQSSVDGVTWSDISGALADILVLTTAQVGRQLRLVASYVDGGGTSESVFSQASSKVAGRGLNLTGTNGNDRLTGAATDDTLSGGLGTDWLSGGAGDDSLCFSADGLWTSGFVCRNDGSPGHAGSGKTVSIAGYSRSFDGMDGGTGTDLLLGTTRNDVFVLDDTYSSRPNGVGPRFACIERFEAGDGNDVVDLTSRRWAYGDVTVAGGNGDDVIWTSGGNDSLSGGTGNDVLDGGRGSDIMAGGLGNDTYVVENPCDAVIEVPGEGIDIVQSMVSYTLGSNLENLLLEGSTPIDGTGNDLSNLLTGNSSSNILSAGAGDDTLDGKRGKDILIGGEGGDTYVFGRGYGSDSVRESEAAPGATDTVRFLSGVSADQIWLRHVGNSLEVGIIGAADKLTLENWYLGSSHHVEQFRTTDGKVLLDSRVESLVQAMAAFAPPASGQTTLAAARLENIAPLIAANWL